MISCIIIFIGKQNIFKAIKILGDDEKATFRKATACMSACLLILFTPHFRILFYLDMKAEKYDKAIEQFHKCPNSEFFKFLYLGSKNLLLNFGRKKCKNK